ncbi:MAG: glycosyltransferase family 4 protein [Pseudomonadota bacterium]
MNPSDVCGEKIRIMTVIGQYYPYLGGAENVARHIVEQTNGDGFCNHVLTESSEAVQKLSKHRLTFQEKNGNHWIYRFSRFHLRGKEKNGPFFKYYTFAKYLLHLVRRRRQYDVIHAHTYYWPAFASVLAGKWLRKPVIVTGHNQIKRLVAESAAGKYPTRLVKALTSTTRYVAISTEIKQEASALLGIAPQKVSLIPNGIDTKRFRPANADERLQIRRRLGIHPDEFVVIYHGRLEQHKHPEKLVELVARLTKAGIRCRGLLVGTGSMQQQLAATLAGEQWIPATLLKFQANIEEYLRVCDAYYLPSEMEGFSLALLEAMASGLPCMANDIPGNRDLIVHGVNGFLLANSQVSEAMSVIQMIRAGQGMEELRRNARKSVVEQYSIANMVDTYKTLYRDVLKRPLLANPKVSTQS